MNRINLNSSERVIFGEFLKDVAQLLCDKKVYDMRSGISVEQSTYEATRVRIEFSYYLTPETQTLLEKLAIQYRELIP
jgi:hypothetical protein